MSISTPKTKVTRYRVTLDVSPNEWNWHELLELEDGEKVNEVYVENLGEYKMKNKRK